MFDLIIRGGRLVDYQNSIDGTFDLGITDGQVTEVSREICLTRGKRVLDATGKMVLPGIIDLHVHTGFVCKGRTGMNNMAKAGTVTAVDLGGPLEEFYDNAVNHGAGLNVACLQMIRPDYTVKGVNPSPKEIGELIEKSLDNGALGLKILGGHYPLSREATRKAIELTNEKGAYIAFHAGTAESDETVLNTLDSFKEAVELAEGYSVQMAHVNAYARGRTASPLEECIEVLRLLEANPNLFSESYLAQFTGAPGRCIDGRLESKGTGNSLSMGGYSRDEKGLRQGILDGYVLVTCELGEESILLTGKEGLEYWEANDGDVTVSCPTNPAVSLFLCATQKNAEGQFIVDAISTDGGGIPRNFIVTKGTALVKLYGLTWPEFVMKTSYQPARILGLENKGHLGQGADADITIVDPLAGAPYAAINRGKIIMLNGVILGTGTTVITTERGENAVRQRGLTPYVVDLERSWFFRGRQNVEAMTK
ncbi:MAG: amidohydrolase family protein [Firmicutes bacterium]|nr:amidohydrolase family protein [Bacillota bacterium]